MSVSIDSTPNVVTIDPLSKEVSIESSSTTVDVITVSSTVDIMPIVNEVVIVSEKGDQGIQGEKGDTGELVVKIRVGTDDTIDTSIYNSIVLTDGCQVTLIGAADTTRTRIYNASSSECVIVAVVEDVTNPTIYPYETFDMEYNLDELRWSV